MKLNIDQIQQVEDHLSQKGLKYVDIRYEVLDHMITDIEKIINSEELSFQKAFNKVKVKWIRSFVDESSLWFGPAENGPKIFVDNYVRIYKSYILKILILTLIIVYSMDYLLNHFFVFQNNYDKEVLIVLYSTVLLNISIILYWYLQIKKTKLQTSFSFIFAKKVLPIVLVLLFLVGFLDVSMHYYRLIIISFIYSLWSGWLLYKNHIKSVSLYSSISTI
jgi:hypothetical protein